MPTEGTQVSGPLRVTGSVWIQPHELSWRFSRSSGPGGQSVNTMDSRVELSFDLEGSYAFPEELKNRALARLQSRLVDGVLTVAASEHRSQLRNREAARARLATTLAEAIAPPPRQRRATKPSKAAIRRRLDAKSQRSQLKKLRRDLSD